MTALIVIAAMILVIAVILSVRIRFRIIYEDDRPQIFAKVLFFKFYLAGEPERPLRLRDFKIARFRKRRDNVLKKYNDKRLEQLKKTAPKKTEEKPKEKTKKSPAALIDDVKRLLEGILERFPRYLNVRVNHLVIRVGAEDAHKTAMLYGEAIQALQYLIAFLRSACKLKKKNGADVGVYPDFLEKGFGLKADIEAHIRVLGVLSIGIKFLKNFLKRRSRSKRAVKNKTLERTAK